jgi:hypothetical protein
VTGIENLVARLRAQRPTAPIDFEAAARIEALEKQIAGLTKRIAVKDAVFATIAQLASRDRDAEVYIVELARTAIDTALDWPPGTCLVCLGTKGSDDDTACVCKQKGSVG